MARAEFNVVVRTVDGREEAVVGDLCEALIAVTPEKTHAKATLEWSVGWTAAGRRTNDIRVLSGRVEMGRIEADLPFTHAVPFTVPPAGPITYQGQLLSVSWSFSVSVDIPWAIDPKASTTFVVVPRGLP